MGTSAIVTPPTGALVDRYSAKALVIAGSLASALGYAGFAFVERPWQAFACSIAGGAPRNPRFLQTVWGVGYRFVEG